MTTAGYDAGLRVRAAETGTPQPRLANPWIRIGVDTVTVASAGKDKFMVAMPNEETRRGVMDAAGVVDAIAGHLGTESSTPWRLLTDTANTSQALFAVAAQNGGSHLNWFSWWMDQTELPTGWSVNAVQLAQDHFVAPDPTKEHSATYWAKALTGEPSGPLGSVWAIMSAVTKLGEGRTPTAIWDVSKYAATGVTQALVRSNGFSVDPGREAVLYATAETMHGFVTGQRIAHDKLWRIRSVWEGRILPARVVSEDPASRASVRRNTVVHVSTPSRYRIGAQLKGEAFTKQQNRRVKDSQGELTGEVTKKTVRTTLTITAITPVEGGTLLTLTHKNHCHDRETGSVVELYPPVRSWSQDKRMLDNTTTNLAAYTWLREPSHPMPHNPDPVPLYVMAAAA